LDDSTGARCYRAGYPLCLDLSGHRVVVVGGGMVAQRKVETLLRYGADVCVVAPETTPALCALADEGAIAWVRRVYREGDLRGARIAFSACGLPEVDRRICAEAHHEHCLVNVVDVPDLCDFTVPSVLERGPLRVAVSTSGTAPTEAKAIRRQLETTFDEAWGPYLELVGQVRAMIRDRIPGGDEQRRPLYEAVCAAGIHERLAAGESLDARTVWEQTVAPLVTAAEGKR